MRASSFVDIALVVGSISLGAYLFFSGGAPTQGEFQERIDNLFSAFLPDKIREIRLKTASQRPIILKKDLASNLPDTYFLGENGKNKANAEAVSTLLRTLEYATWERIVSEDSALSNQVLGFESPQLEARILAGPRSYRLLIGAQAPTPPHSVYARVEGKSIDTKTGVIQESLLIKLARGEQVFRGSRLFLTSRRNTQSLTIEKAKRRISLKADGLGFLLQPPQETTSALRADRTRSDLIFYQLARASIGQFVDLDFAKSAIEEDAQAVVVKMSSPGFPLVEVQFGGKCPHDNTSILALRLHPDKIAGCVPVSILGALHYTHSQLIDRHVFPLNSDEIDHIVIIEDSEKLDLIRKGENFQLLSRDSASLTPDIVRDFLDILSDRPLEYLNNPTNPRQGPIANIEVRGQSPSTFSSKRKEISEQKEALHELKAEIFRAEDQTLLVHRLDDGAWLRVPRPLKWAFTADDSWARSRQLLKVKEDEIVSFELKDRQGHIQRVGRTPTGFSFSPSRDELPDFPLVRRVLSELSGLQALRFITSIKRDPQQDLLRVEFKVRPLDHKKVRTEILWIGRPTRGGNLAWSTFTPGTFVLPSESLFVLSASLLDRAQLDLDPKYMVQLDITGKSRSYAFTRQAGLLIANGGEARDDMAGALEEALGSLQVLGTAHRSLTEPSSKKKLLLRVRGQRKLANGDSKSFAFSIGKSESWEGQGAFVAWREQDNTTYFIARSGVEKLLQLL